MELMGNDASDGSDDGYGMMAWWSDGMMEVMEIMTWWLLYKDGSAGSDGLMDLWNDGLVEWRNAWWGPTRPKQRVWGICKPG